MLDNNQKSIIDCWNKIGVWRETTEICPKLAHVRHCKHCDVFINAGLELLNRDLPEDYIRENAEIYRRQKDHTKELSVSYLFFRLADEWYGIKSSLLVEIDDVSNVHSIPHNHNNIIEGMIRDINHLEEFYKNYKNW